MGEGQRWLFDAMGGKVEEDWVTIWQVNTHNNGDGGDDGDDVVDVVDVDDDVVELLTTMFHCGSFPSNVMSTFPHSPLADPSTSKFQLIHLQNFSWSIVLKISADNPQNFSWSILKHLAKHLQNITFTFSVVSSYFLFLRWVFYINFLIAGVILALIILPELLSGHWKKAGVK